MKKCFLYFLFFFISTIYLQAIEYEARLVGTESFSDCCISLNGINDKGFVFGDISRFNNQTSQYESGHFVSNLNGDVFISPFLNDGSYHAHQLNDKGEILGSVQKGSGFHFAPHIYYIWDPIRGFYYLEKEISAVALKNNKLLCYKNKEYFFWNGGIETPLNIKALIIDHLTSFNRYLINDFCITSINNNDEICGLFYYGKYNKYTNKIVKTGFKVFVHSKDDFRILDLSEKCPSDYEINHALVQINEKGSVLITTTPQSLNPTKEKTTYLTILWNKNNELNFIHDFEGISFNNADTILGYSQHINDNDIRRIPAIYKNNKITFLAEMLGVKNLYSMAPKYSDEYLIESISGFININNKGQIACKAKIWDIEHPCILNPINSEGN